MSRAPAFPVTPWAVSVLFAAAAGCAPEAAPPAEDPASSGTAPDAAVLMEADRAFAADVEARGLEGWVEAFSPEGVLIRGDAVVEGPDSIRAAMAPAFAEGAPTLRWEPEGARLGSGGELGYTWGRYRVEAADSVTGRGRYLTVWRRQPDGSWKVDADIGSPVEGGG